MYNLKQRIRLSKFSFGIMLTIAVDILAVSLFQLVSIFLPNLLSYADFFFLGLGLIQAIYMLPVILILKHKQQFDLLKGVIHTVKITLFLTSPCWIFLLCYFLLLR
jgi:hypothetical protein